MPKTPVFASGVNCAASAARMAVEMIALRSHPYSRTLESIVGPKWLELAQGDVPFPLPLGLFPGLRVVLPPRPAEFPSPVRQLALDLDVKMRFYVL